MEQQTNQSRKRCKGRKVMLHTIEELIERLNVMKDKAIELHRVRNQYSELSGKEYNRKHAQELLDDIQIGDCSCCITLKLDTKKLINDYVDCHVITSILNTKIANIWSTSNFNYDETYSYIVIRTSNNFYNNETIETLKNRIIYDIEIKGIKDVTKLYVKNNNSLETDGSNLKDLLMIKEYIDIHKCFSNDIIEVYETFGIEAARTVLLNEIRNVIQFDGSYVNVRHLELLVDTMTYRGGLMSITRHGINRNDTGPLMKCSFEETVNVLINAAVNSQIDHLRGVTETIMLGKTSKIGTGFVDILLDVDKLYNTYSEFSPSSPKRTSESYFSSYFPLKEMNY